MMCIPCRDPEHNPEDCRDATLVTPGCACQHRKGTKIIVGPKGEKYVAPPGVTSVDVMR